MIGNTIKTARQQKGISSYELSKRLGIAPQQMAMWERANHIHLRSLERIARALEMAPSELLRLGEKTQAEATP